MPNYDLLFRVHPSGFFGLPEEGKTVFPIGGGDITSPVFNVPMGTTVTHGTLSKYRDSPLVQTFTVEGATLTFNDDYLTVSLQVPDDRSAAERSVAIADHFCTLLSAYGLKYFYAEILRGLNKDTGVRIPIPRVLFALSVRIYNTAELAAHMEDASAASTITDPALDKASAYFHHALFQQEQRLRHVDPRTLHFKFITSEIFLNCSKAVSTILGDPSADSDYQSRYRRFGMPQELWEAAERLRDVRNDYDVAHYAVDWGPLEAIQAQEGFAISTAQQVIKAYVEWLTASAGRRPSPETGEAESRDAPNS